MIRKTIEQILEDTTIAELVGNEKKIVTIPSNATIKDALKVAIFAVNECELIIEDSCNP